MLPRLWPGAVSASRSPFQTVGRPPQGNLTQGSQVLLCEKMPHGLGGLLFLIDLSGPEPLQKIRRLQIYYLNLGGRVEYMIGNTLRDGDASDGGNYIVETLQVRHIDGCINTDPCAQQFLHILIPLEMAAALRICVGKLIHKNQLRMAAEGGVQIKFL